MTDSDDTLNTPLEDAETEEESTEESSETTETSETSSKPVSKYMTVSERLIKASITIENASNNNTIAEALLTLGYDAAKLDEGRALVAAARVLANLQEVNYAHCIATKEEYLEYRREMVSFYSANRSIAKALFEDDEGLYGLLRLNDPMERTISEQLLQIERFFINAIADAEVVAAYAAHNISLEMLESGITKAHDTESSYGIYKDAEGVAQETTQDREDALEAMEDWLNIMLVFAKLALVDDPQLMESLLVLVRSPSPASKDRQKTPPKIFDTPPFGIDDPDPGP